jgi:ubiquinone/menaquinone biosynthesis C-methylase UbiE
MQTYFHTTFAFNEIMLQGLNKSDKVLDVGAGDGKRVDWLNENGYQAIGTEINEYWFRNTIVYGDMHDLPFVDNSFHMVCSIDVLEHTPRPLRALSELFRVSKKYVLAQITTTEDGSMYEDPTHVTMWSAERWEREMSEFGTIIVKFKDSTYLMEKK